MFPRAEFGKNRRVATVDAVASGSEHIGDLSFMNKDCGLCVAPDQWRPVLDLLIANRKAIKHGVARIVEPLNYFNELRARAEPVKNSHFFSISFVLTEASVAPSLYAQGRGFVQGSEFWPTTSADIHKGVLIKVMLKAQRRSSRKGRKGLTCRRMAVAVAWTAILYAGATRSSAQPNRTTPTRAASVNVEFVAG